MNGYLSDGFSIDIKRFVICCLFDCLFCLNLQSYITVNTIKHTFFYANEEVENVHEWSVATI